MQINTLYLHFAFEDSGQIHHSLQGVHLQHGDILFVINLQTIEGYASLAETDGYLVNLHSCAKCILQHIDALSIQPLLHFVSRKCIDYTTHNNE